MALTQVANWYTYKAKMKMLRDVTLPYAELSTEPGSQLFICTVLQGLGLHPWVKSKSRNILVNLLQAPRLTEFAGLVNLLTDFDTASGQSVTDKAKVGLLGSAEKRLLEDQKLQKEEGPLLSECWADKQQEEERRALLQLWQLQEAKA